MMAAGRKQAPVLQSAQSGVTGLAIALIVSLSCTKAPPNDVVSDTVQDRSSMLEDAARDVIRFLRGEADYAILDIADSVDFIVAPEGGAANVRVSRERLGDTAAWKIPARQATYSLVPPADHVENTYKAGTHFNCREYELASRFSSLAARPHVGVRMQPPGATSCLQSWNTTFVFDTTAGRTRLVAAVYDQWEW